MARNTLQQAKKGAFLASYAETATVLHAARAAGIDRVTHYRWLASDPDYAQAFAQASEDAVERMEREAVRRAVEGVEEPVYQGGKLVGHINRYSDTLLIFLLKAARPDRYREKPHETNVYNDNRSVSLPEGTTLDDLRALRDGLRQS